MSVTFNYILYFSCVLVHVFESNVGHVVYVYQNSSKLNDSCKKIHLILQPMYNIIRFRNLLKGLFLTTALYQFKALLLSFDDNFYITIWLHFSCDLYQQRNLGSIYASIYQCTQFQTSDLLKIWLKIAS